MKIFFRILFLFLVVTQICFAQWFWQNHLPQGNNLKAVYFVSSTVGGAVGDFGTILRTTDGGTTWTSQTSGTTSDLWDVSFIDANTGIAVGGTILRTIDGGTTWTSQTSGTTRILFGVSFTDADTGTAVGGSGTILRTTDGGTSWISQSSGTINDLFGVSFTDAYRGTAVGREGTILRTSNGGTTWTLQTSGTTNQLIGVSFTDVYTGTTIGEGGTILRTTGGGVTFGGEENLNVIPHNYFLSNNFPNPFNPSTKIRYSISHLSQVQIKVYDILGKEIETLVNEEKSTGTYEVTWYAENLPSGVYFYQMKAGSYINTKKMILLK